MKIVGISTNRRVKELRAYTRSNAKCVELLKAGFKYDYICDSLKRLSRKF